MTLDDLIDLLEAHRMKYGGKLPVVRYNFDLCEWQPLERVNTSENIKVLVRDDQNQTKFEKVERAVVV